ncbi:MAG: bifunctional adenosylcobinamide kinase/adenosylcobinamide-phosphate guanylyltransferase [Pyramidobacter sp.]|uniref:bifunctional adenosylcobinamide kinase/adenosylcobinamide-phosphate guanylyltransferase n=1 Tax=Pyramidobacter sp. TaxID=1943581 RepID=UPI002A825A33|nr:bifunctional adenosylcobinamide kinase/adenosylcobinamide-phosphate guanylyltransferase [Pyramidobacter sp.]MDY4031529.1 bifunctional adenosylcobinamide kinase/adenosylcobinamide-phosphate guanylyltransferase [Pyramidobacter sp.]
MNSEWKSPSGVQVRMVTGGWRSGASAFALKLAQDWERKTIISAQTSTEEDMLEHIALYQKGLDDGCETIVEGVDLDQALDKVRGGVCIVDDLGAWVSNLTSGSSRFAGETCPEIEAFVRKLRRPPCEVIVVTRELGMGLPSERIAERRYRDVVGRLNQRVAALAASVYLCVSGLPLKLK